MGELKTRHETEASFPKLMVYLCHVFLSRKVKENKKKRKKQDNGTVISTDRE